MRFVHYRMLKREAGTLKTIRRMEAENEQLRQAIAQRDQRENTERIYARWISEGSECTRIYPDFELERECRSPETGERFMGLLQNGVDVKTAYELIHKDELLGGAIRYAVETTRKRTMDNIRARGMRPSENGASGSAPAQVVKKDPSRFTRADRDEISRRVLRGDRIEL